MKRWAEISSCGLYRYSLGREWAAENGTATFIMLNPSTADGEKDDPTIRRCIRFAQGWGYGRLLVSNLFAYRATDPKELMRVSEPLGPRCNQWLLENAKSANVVIAAWGVLRPWGWKMRATSLIDWLFDKRITRHVGCLGLTKGGYPKHPLYVRADQALRTFRAPGL